jgi:bifunctional non-homologous end joining protein LigD
LSVTASSWYYKDAKSDKEYHIQIDEVPGGYMFRYRFGARGSSMRTTDKTTSPVPLAAAQKLYDAEVKKRTSKGYTQGEDGTPYAGTDKAGEVSGFIPQLLNPVDADDAQALVNSEDFLMQEKKDGVRQTIIRKGTEITAANRKGLLVGCSQVIADAVLALHTKRDADFVLDGEAIGDVYWPFDIRVYAGQSTEHMSAENRLAILNGLLDTVSSPAIGRVPTAMTVRQKQDLFAKIKAARGEGVVFKKFGSKYVPGRPNSGGNQLKHKFKGSATVQVIEQNAGKRSVVVGVMSLVHDGYVTAIGNVTIPSNYSVPSAGSFVEVEYLYAFPGGSLFQPVYKGPRADKTEADLASSLKFKQNTLDEDNDA